MQEMAFQGFKFGKFSRGQCPPPPDQTSTPSNESGQIPAWFQAVLLTGLYLLLQEETN
jgi:hypothetical protein